MDFQCPECDKLYKNRNGLSRHVKAKHGQTELSANECTNDMVNENPQEDQTSRQPVPDTLYEIPAKTLKRLDRFKYEHKSPPPCDNSTENPPKQEVKIFACNECQRIRTQYPGGWISVHCHLCGMPVYFTCLTDRNKYATNKSSRDLEQVNEYDCDTE